MWRYNEKNLGEFVEVEHGKWFSYKETENTWAKENNLPHEIDVLDGVRFARVLKTVAHVAVDEDSEGKAVIEKWHIRKHISFGK